MAKWGGVLLLNGVRLSNKGACSVLKGAGLVLKGRVQH